MLMTLRAPGLDPAVVYHHLGCLKCLEQDPGQCQIAVIEIVGLGFEQGRVEDQHWPIDAVFLNCASVITYKMSGSVHSICSRVRVGVTDL